MRARVAVPQDGRREGFALLAVLWVIVGMSALTLAGSLEARGAVASAQNRRALAVARWRAEWCLERVRAVAAEVLRDDGGAAPAGRRPSWATLDRAVATGRTLDGCDVALRSTGDAVDVNAADAAQLLALFAAAGAGLARADSLADAVLDWRDGDSIPRPAGAERDDYLRRRHTPPRDAAFADVRELRLVRGLEAGVVGETPIASLLTAEPGRIVLARAPPAVLASLPGMTPEAVARVFERRTQDASSVGDLLVLGASLSKTARDSLLAHYAELVALTSPEPEAWIVTSRAAVRVPPAASVSAQVEVRLVRAGARAAVVRRRSVQ